MKFSFQTICIVFCVTLVHLVAIAAIAPLDDAGGQSPRVLPDIEIPGFADEPAETAEAAEKSAPEDTVAGGPAPGDPPALRREEASAPAPSEPVAESPAAPRGEILARPFAPFPRS